VILDSSAIIAVLLGEPDATALLAQLESTSILGVGAPTLAETGVVLTARLGPAGATLLARFVEVADASVVAFADQHWLVAVDAFTRFGKGRHPAALNFGDCMTYATAHVAGQPLLCLGDDFDRTDLPLVTL
jgi:ribonuclease VapC